MGSGIFLFVFHSLFSPFRIVIQVTNDRGCFFFCTFIPLCPRIRYGPQTVKYYSAIENLLLSPLLICTHIRVVHIWNRSSDVTGSRMLQLATTRIRKLLGK